MRPLVTVCVVVASLGAAAGCTGSSGPSSPVNSTTASPTSAAPTSPAVASPTTDATPTTSPTPSPSTAQAGGAPTCATDALRLTAKNGGAAAGTSFQLLVVENISDAACTVYGYPGASFLGTDGNRLGSPARRDPSVKPHRIRLAPGDKASARLGTPNPEMFPESDCHSEQATAVRVYPPDQTAPLQDSVDQRVCTTKKGRASVSAFEAGSP